MTIPSWVVELAKFEKERPAGRSLSRNMALLLVHRDFDTINEILGSVDWSKLPASVIMGFVRLTAVVRDFCPNWPTARDAVYKELQSRNLDADGIMMGLL